MRKRSTQKKWQGSVDNFYGPLKYQEVATMRVKFNKWGFLNPTILNQDITYLLKILWIFITFIKNFTTTVASPIRNTISFWRQTYLCSSSQRSNTIGSCFNPSNGNNREAMRLFFAMLLELRDLTFSFPSGCIVSTLLTRFFPVWHVAVCRPHSI